jgi:hypothetical protein
MARAFASKTPADAQVVAGARKANKERAEGQTHFALINDSLIHKSRIND